MPEIAGDVYICIEGGPGVAEEAQIAHARGRVKLLALREQVNKRFSHELVPIVCTKDPKRIHLWEPILGQPMNIWQCDHNAFLASIGQFRHLVPEVKATNLVSLYQGCNCSARGFGATLLGTFPHSAFVADHVRGKHNFRTLTNALRKRVLTLFSSRLNFVQMTDV